MVFPDDKPTLIEKIGAAFALFVMLAILGATMLGQCGCRPPDPIETQAAECEVENPVNMTIRFQDACTAVAVPLQEFQVDGQNVKYLNDDANYWFSCVELGRDYVILAVAPGYVSLLNELVYGVDGSITIDLERIEGCEGDEVVDDDPFAALQACLDGIDDTNDADLIWDFCCDLHGDIPELLTACADTP